MGAKTKKPAVSKATAKLQAKYETIMRKMKPLAAKRDALEKGATILVRAFNRVEAAHEKTMAKYTKKIDAANAKLTAYELQRAGLLNEIAQQEVAEQPSEPRLPSAYGDESTSSVPDGMAAADLPDPPPDDDQDIVVS